MRFSQSAEHLRRVIQNLRCFCASANRPRLSSYSTNTAIKEVSKLQSWDLEPFQEAAFNNEIPARLGRANTHLPPACSKWFIHEGAQDFDLHAKVPFSSELRTSFWSEHEQTIVPLELSSEENGSDDQDTFHRADAPLKLLLTYLSNPKSPNSSSLRQPQSIYLAQCDLRDLPTSLQADVPTPTLVRSAGKGDIYSSSLWMGRPPTYTPLHRDPNPNLFFQLVGQKSIRLFPPEIGHAIFQHVQNLLSKQRVDARQTPSASASFRGEEMMQGAEKQILHEIVWTEEQYPQMMKHAQQVDLALGEALFIPKGWWHSVKGVGSGVTASVNWWFR